MTTLSLDYEGGSEAQLVGPKSVGLFNYMRHPSTRPFMLAWSFDEGRVEQVDFTDGGTLPPDVREALLDPHVEKWAFNAGFERTMTREVMGIPTPIKGWRCSMALAYMRSFTGGLADVGVQIGMDARKLKDPIGDKCIQMFCKPQRITKNQPLLWRDRETDPEMWNTFLDYNRQDVIAEMEVKKKLIRYPILPSEWVLYEIDQEINDRGLPVDMQFVLNAKEMAARRKGELMQFMREVTSLDNPNSVQQLIPWLIERGYRFNDLQKLTIKKELAENVEGQFLDGSAIAALRLRQQASRSSVKKYDAIERRISGDGRLRHCFQFCGAARTNRWSGRGPQPQNLVKTPGVLEGDDGDYSKLEVTTDTIRRGDYDTLELLFDEPMVALAGCLRSSFRAPDGYEFVVCDLSAIESAVGAWLSGCKRMLGVFRDGLDPYRDFGTELYLKPYADITKAERTICKPPTLGCSFGLGGGKLFNGKRTGLWGYAEGMGVDITREEAARQVKLFRTIYPEIPEFWKSLDNGCKAALKGREVTINGKLTLSMRPPFMTMQLPSRRLMFYHKPAIKRVEFIGKDNEPYTRDVFTCMGMSQVTKRWGRILSGGPKLFENAVQATARDVLGHGVRAARKFGFRLVGTVHDEIIALRRKGDNRYGVVELLECMVSGIPWAGGLPLGANGWVGTIYRKD